MKRELVFIIMVVCSIIIYAQTAKTHTIQRGETPEKIAKQYGIPFEELIKANPGIEKVYYVGRTLIIPNTQSNHIKDTSNTSTMLSKTENYPPKRDHSSNDLSKKVVGENSGDLHLIADVWGGYSNFSWANGSPKMGFGFGADVGVQCNYNMLWSKIPKGLLGELTIGYARRGSGAFPINYFGIRVHPVAYRLTIQSNLSLISKVGLYMGIPISKIKTDRSSYTTCVDYGLSVGAGVEYGKWGLLASYEHGFANTLNHSKVNLYNRGAFLTLSYKFLKLK